MASSSLLNATQERPLAVDWARLIPGEAPAQRRNLRKPVRSARPTAAEKVTEISTAIAASVSRNTFTLLLPEPLRGRMASRWMRAMAADFALIGLNWLLIGALQIPLRWFLPAVRALDYGIGAPISLLGIAVVHAALITLVAYTEGLHACDLDLRRQARILAKSVLWATAVLFLGYRLQSVPWPMSSLIAVAGVLHFGALWTWRWSATQEDGFANPNSRRNVLIVGAGSVGREVADRLERHPGEGRRVCGFLDNAKPLGNGVIGRVSDLARLARTGFVDDVILAAPHDRGLAMQVLRETRRLRLDLEIVPDLFGCKPARAEVEQVGDLPVICLHAERIPALGLALKRSADLIVATLALILASPLLASIAVFIKFDSPGPILYCANRAGRKGRQFRCYKFRTMVADADGRKEQLRKNNQRSGPFFKIDDDPRITRIGRLLRRYSLDELPQLLNVVKGDMSLVGPRPHPLDDVAGYEIGHLARLDVTPGITGLWQVSARRDPSFQRGMELDREYIRTWSLRSDARILLRTVLAVARGSGQ